MGPAGHRRGRTAASERTSGPPRGDALVVAERARMCYERGEFCERRLMTEHHFSEMRAERPSYDAVAAAYDELFAALAADPLQAVRRWDALRRGLSAYKSLAGVRFACDTRDADARAEREYSNEFFPRITDFATRFKRELIARRAELEPTLGGHVFDLWAADIATFDPAIEADLVEEGRLTTAREELIASAEVEFEGESLNLAQLSKHQQSADRDHRERATRAYWAWFEAHADAADQSFDELVSLRTQMARSLGYSDYLPLGYQRMQRIDYGEQDVARFRAEVVEHIVPLAHEIKAHQAQTLGVDRLMVCDEPVHDPSGTPAPQGTTADQIAAAHRMFDAMHPELGSFFAMMDRRGLMDLDARKGKAAGGFCTSLEDGVPFIFANFNGTHGDLHTFTHEMGHAFQAWLSRENYPMDLVWPTLESCEIHSMGLEFLCAPHMELFFGEDADRYRRLHLTENLTFIPYGVAVDHFQHLVYANPDASPADRRAMWQQMEATYLPWRNWGDIAHGTAGGMWHRQGHIYSAPFYYIDYVLALTCALQIWAQMLSSPQQTLDAYVALCRRGGSAPFQDLVRSASLRSPFEPGSLVDAVDRAREALAL